MKMLDEIRAKREAIWEIARRHKAEKLWVFGSCARGEERPDSDVDLLVKFGGGVGLLEYCRMEDEMAATIGRDVDLVNAAALERSPFFSYNARKDMVEL